jgi:hypothetical protein
MRQDSVSVFRWNIQIKTPHPKPEADADHSIAGGAANLIRHT